MQKILATVNKSFVDYKNTVLLISMDREINGIYQPTNYNSLNFLADTQQEGEHSTVHHCKNIA